VVAPLIIAAALLPPVLARCRDEFPHAVVRIVDATVDHLIESVADGHAEVAIGPDRQAVEGVERQVLFVSRWVLWCRPGHPLTALDEVRWQDLANVPVIMPGHDYQFYVSLLLQTLAPDLRITPTHVVEQMTTALGLAAAGLGVTLGPEYALPVARAWPLVMRPLAPPGVERDICLYTSSSRLLPAAAAAVVPRLAELLRGAGSL
jgi:DNA-binding transcriptional LysR family regulator